MFFPAKAVSKNQKTLFRDVKLQFGEAQTEYCNAEFFNGKLCPLRNTFKQFYGSEKVFSILCVAKDGLFVLTNPNGVVFIDFNDGTETQQFIHMQELPIGFTCYYNSAIASCDDSFRYVVDYRNGDYLNADGKQAVCKLSMCGSRLIGVKDDWLLLFESTHEGDFSVNEKIQLPSNCFDIAVINSNTAYLLGDTVYKLTVKEDNSDVKLEKAAYNLGKTVFNTSSVIDGRVVFVSQNGLQLISSGKVNRICKFLDEYVCDYSKTAGAYFDGKYYLACTLNTPSGKKDATLVIDLATEKVTKIYGKKYEQLITGSGKLFAKLNGFVYILTDEPSPSVSLTKRNVDFGGQATLKALHLQHKGRADIVIRNDIGAVQLSVYGNGRKKRYRIGKLAGKFFDVEASFYGDCFLQSLMLEAGGRQ